MDGLCPGSTCPVPWLRRAAKPASAHAGTSRGETRQEWLEGEIDKVRRQLEEVAASNERLRKATGVGPEQVHFLPDDAEEACADNQFVHSAAHPSKSTSTLRPSVTIRMDTEEADEIFEMHTSNSSIKPTVSSWVVGQVNTVVLRGSALSMRRPAQASMYMLALAGIIFVFVATATHLGAHDVAHGEHADSHGSGAHGEQHHGGAGEDGHHGEIIEHGGRGGNGTHGQHLGGGGGGSEHPAHGGSHGHGGGSDADGHPGSERHGDHAGDGEPFRGAFDPGRRLGGAAPALLKDIAFSLVGAGIFSLAAYALKLPLIIGYLLAGVLVGPVGLGIVENQLDIEEIAELGLLFLLFMVGIELNIMELRKLGRVMNIAGLVQFPLCAAAVVVILKGLTAVGLNLGGGQHAETYCGLVCGLSSTMIVTKLISEKGQADSQSGRLTIGILIYQDLWALVVMAVQPRIVANHQFLMILKTLAMVAILIVVALFYAKFVMPAVLFQVKNSVELMLIFALSWCFFVCCVALLPFIGLSMEIAALIAGLALAAFPYSSEFMGKMRYIRDFFITLFFAGLGMKLPVPTLETVGTAVLLTLIVLIFRWVSIFLVVWALGGGPRLGALGTINLCQISEFALVICTMGNGYGHIDEHTTTIIIWTFTILAIVGTFLIEHNHRTYGFLERGLRILASSSTIATAISEPGEGEDEDAEVFEDVERDIVLLGFNRVASMLIAEFQMRNPQILRRIHIIDVNEDTLPKLRKKGIKCSYRDFSMASELESVHKGACRIVISTIPDSLLEGTTNQNLLKISKEVWPGSHFIATADNPYEAQQLYEGGADYVLRLAKLCGERLNDLISQHCSWLGPKQDIFEYYKLRDKDHRGTGGFITLKV